MSNCYDSWASIYDSVFSYVKDDILFYTNEARNCNTSVLELGCGTGRVAIPLANAGVDVIGIDISKPMLEVAQNKTEEVPPLHGSLKLIHSDMRNFSLNTTFDLIIIPFRGFLSLLSVEDQVCTLKSISRHLGPNGRLIFDVFVPDLELLVENSGNARYLRDVTGSENRLVLWHQSQFDHYNQIMDITLIADQVDDLGISQKRFYRSYQIRYIHRWEILHLLSSCGYEITGIYGDFNNSDFDESSTEMVLVTRLKTRI